MQCPSCSHIFEVAPDSGPWICPGCGATAAAPAAPVRPPRRAGVPFGRYRLIEQLGTGAMGVVWRAWDDALGREVALKQVRFPERSGAETRARFRREARLIARLRHPNLATVHDVGVTAGTDYFTMDLVEGRPFSELLVEARAAAPAGRLEGEALRRAVTLLADVAEAVAAAHAQGVVHRDLKPAHVLVDAAGVPRVVDFGLARESTAEAPAPTGEALTQAGEVLGTAGYMSPEQASGEAARVGPASDQFALGSMLYEVLAGRLPYEGATPRDVVAAKVRGEAVPPPTRFAPEAPAELEAPCLRALEREPGRRYPSVGAFAEDLRRWLRGDVVRVQRPGALEHGLRWLERNKASVALVVAAILVPLLVVESARRTRAGARRGLRDFLDRAARAGSELEDRLARVEAAPEIRRGYAEETLSLIRARLAEFPGDPAALAWRGQVKALLGRDDEALRDFDAACAHEEAPAVAWYLRGTWRLERGLLGRVGGEAPNAGVETAVTGAESGAALAELAEAERRAEARGGLGAEPRRLARAAAALFGSADDGAERALAELGDLDVSRAWRLRGWAARRLGRLEEAVAAFDRVAAVWPNDILARFGRAVARHASGRKREADGEDPVPDLRAAIQDLDHLIERHGPLPQAWFERGMVKASLGSALADRNQDPRLVWREALADLDAVERCIPAIIRALVPVPALVAEHAPLFGRRAQVRLLLAEAEMERGGDAEALLLGARADFEQARRLGHLDPGMGLERARLALALARRAETRSEDPAPFYRSAEEELDEEVDRRPESYEILVQRAQVRIGLAEADARAGADPRLRQRAAVDDLGAAIRLAPERADLLEERALALRRLGLEEARRGGDAAAAYRGAVADLDALLAQDPNAPTARMHRGLLLRHLGDALAGRGGDPFEAWSRALLDLDAVLERDPGRAEARAFRAELRAAMAGREAAEGRDAADLLRGAAEDFDHALAARGDDPGLRSARAEVYLRRAAAEGARGRDPRFALRAAIADLSHALERSPDDEGLLRRRAEARESLGDAERTRGGDGQEAYEGAAADAAEVLRLRPGEAEAALRRARCAVQLADRDEKDRRDPLPRLREAIEALAVVPATDPRRGEILGMRGGLIRRVAVRLEAGRRPAEAAYREAIADLGAALAARGDDPALRFERGEASVRLARLVALRGEDAGATFRQAEADLVAAAAAGLPLAHFSLARLFEGLGRWEDAIAAYEAGAKAMPQMEEFVRERIEACRGRLRGGMR